MNTQKLHMISLVLETGLSGAAQAALQARDLDGNLATFEAYYDTDLNITWLADANYAQTSGYDADGMMNWGDAKTWAANLSFTDGVNVYDNWRLPTTLQPDASCGSQAGGVSYGNGCAGSEMGHLVFLELGGVAGWGITTTHNSNYNLFQNIDPLSTYWSETEYVPDATRAWTFSMYNSYQFGGYKNQYPGYYAWAVSSGEVGIAAIPEADTWAMLLAGLGLVGFAVRRRVTVK